MKNFIKDNFIILIIILILFLYLGIKAFDKNGWDGWGFGSAQTLMSSQYWARDGFAKNYFLFIPSPHSKLIPYLDKPEFRNRAIDDSGGALKRNRIYYTHYPPLYLMPFAVLAKIGFVSRSAARIFALVLSLAGLIFFYWFVKLIRGKTTAIVATIYYGLSVTFLNYADSASIQPFNIFFTFLILVLIILASNNFEDHKTYQSYNLAIWLFYFALSLSSFDATFFVFSWLILYDAIILKKFLWKRWLFFVSAPVLGFSLQILQNVWYLGWHDMLRDFYNAYKIRQIGTLKNFILGIVTPFVSMTGIKTIYFFKKTMIALGSAVLIIGILWKFRPKANLNCNFFRIVFVLAVAAMIQPFFINVTGLWPYQGVLAAPFWGLLIGASSVFVIRVVKEKRLDIYKIPYFWILTTMILILWSAQFYNTFVYAKDWPNNVPNQKVIEFSKEIKNLYPDKERIAFRIYPASPIWKNSFPTFDAEYFIGMLTIDFANARDLIIDFRWLRNVSEYPFYSFIISENKIDAEKIRRELFAKNLKNISPIMNIQGQYLFTVGPK